MSWMVPWLALRLLLMRVKRLNLILGLAICNCNCTPKISVNNTLQLRERGARILQRNEDLSCYPSCIRNHCSHPRCFPHATCLSYFHCNLCGTRKACL
jgi:hypothetical protein